MSRRKQGRPQQRKALDSLEQEKDLLVCGDCQSSFALHDIVAFIRHKKGCLDKENLKQDRSPDDGGGDATKTGTKCHKVTGVAARTNSDGDDTSATRRADEGVDNEDDDDDEDDEAVSVSKTSRREEGDDVTVDEDDDDDDDDDSEEEKEEEDTSKKDGNDTESTINASEQGQEGEDENEKKRKLRKKMKKKKRLEMLKKEAEAAAKAISERELKREHSSESRAPLRPKNVVDAESNTTLSEPTRFVCETCRSTYTSAWSLLQHAQKEHGMKIYTSPSSSNSSSSNNTSNSSSTSSSNAKESRHHHHRSPSAATTPGAGSMSPMDLVVGASSPRVDHHHHHHRPVSTSSVSTISASVSSPYAVHHAPNPFSTPFRLPLDARLPQPQTLSPYGRGHPTSLDFDLINDYRLRPQYLAAARHGFDAPHGMPFPHHPGHAAFQDRSRAAAAHISPVLDYNDYYSMRLKQLAGSPVIGGAPGSKSPFSAAAASAALAAHHHQQQQQAARTPTPGHANSGSKVSSSDLSPRNGGNNNNSNAIATNNNNSVGLPPKLKSCEFCGKSFRFQSNLVVHRRSHTGEKPYKCPLCPHACTQQSKLKRHMKTHAVVAKTGNENPDASQSDVALARKDGVEDEEEDEEDEEEEEEEEEEEIVEEEMNDEEREVLETMKKAEKREDTVVPEPGEIRHDAKRIKLEVNKDEIDEETGVNAAEDDEEKPSDLSMKRRPQSESVLSEVMKNSGLASIQTYTEAFEAALAESQVNGQDTNQLPKSDKHERSSSNKRHNSEGTPVSPRHGVKRERESDVEKDRKDRHNKTPTKAPSDVSTGPVPAGWPTGIDGLPAHPAALDPATAAAAASLYSRLPHPWFHPENPVRLFFPGYHPRFPSHVTPRDLSIPMVGDIANSAIASAATTNGLNLSQSSVASNNSALSASPSIPALYKPALSSPTGYPGRRGTSSASSSPTTSHVLPSNGSSGTASNSSTPRKPDSNSNSKRNDTCEYCGKVFKNCSNLTVHRRSHTGEKPYKCSLCNYACAQSSKLTRHMKTHGRLGKDVYTCKFCNMPFSVPSTLEKHMRKCVENRNAHLLSQDGDMSSESNGEHSMQSEPADMSSGSRKSEPLEMPV